MLKKALHLSTQDTDDFRIQLHRRTFGILFLGTPHKGSKLASPASALAKGARVFTRANINLLDALKRNSVLLDEYHHTFLVWLRERKEQGNELMLINYYEMLEYKGAGLVSSIRSLCYKSRGSWTLNVIDCPTRIGDNGRLSCSTNRCKS